MPRERHGPNANVQRELHKRGVSRQEAQNTTKSALGVVASLPGPRYWWLSVPAIFLGEHLYALIAYPDLRPWFLFSIVINFTVPMWWPAAVGALFVFSTNRLLTNCSTSRGDERRDA
jgi:hypothetical protein